MRTHKHWLIGLTAVAALFLVACNTNPSRAAAEPAVGAGTSALSAPCVGEPVGKDTANTSRPGIVTAGDRLYHHECYAEVLEQVLATSHKPLVLFVHGRGPHPSKEFKDQLLESIQTQYDVTAVMFTWPSYAGKSGFPEDEARQAGLDLAYLMEILADIKQRNNDQRSMVLLTHSMGAIVLSGMVTAGSGLPADLFENAIISAGAAGLEGHSQWVEKVHFAKRTYVTANQSDKALTCLEGKPKLICRVGLGFHMSPRLGRWAVAKSDEVDLADNAVYVGFGGAIGKTHRYYINQHTSAPKVFDFYRQGLNGETPTLDGFKEKKPGQVYVIGR